jgi:very-short-patch-repair endonuclease
MLVCCFDRARTLRRARLARRGALTPSRHPLRSRAPLPGLGEGPPLPSRKAGNKSRIAADIESMGRWLHNSTYRARALRRTSTPAERALWEHLRDRRLDGVKFRRQHAIGTYYADFCAVGVRLVVEADGAHHFPRTDYERARDEWLRGAGYVVLRLTNREILYDIEGALAKIRATIRRASRAP